MNNNKISLIEITSMVIMLIMSTFIGIGTYGTIKTSGVDAYISPILAFLFFIPVYFIYRTINNYQKDLPMNQKMNNLYGKLFGTIINIAIVILISLIGISLFYNLMCFIKSQFLSETPITVVGIVFSLIIIYINTKDINTFARTSLLFFFINAVLYGISLMGLISKVELTNLKPFLENGIKDPIISGMKLVILNILPVFLLLIVPKNKVSNKEKYTKAFFIGFSITIALMFLVILTTIGVSGINLASLYEYPEYVVLKNINAFDFISRIENIVFIQWIFGLFFNISFIVHYISNTIKFKNKSKLLPCIITTGLLTASLMLFPNITVFDEYVYNIFPITGTVLLCIYFIIAISIKFKTLVSKETQS